MGMPVVTVASGGLPVVDVTATTGRGTPVTEAANQFGCAVTKVASGGIPVVYETIGQAPVVRATFDGVNSAQVTISNAGRTATLTTSVPTVGARSTFQKSTGLFYVEFFVTASHGGANWVCLLTSAGTYSDISSNQNVLGVISSGGIYSNNTTTGKNIGAFVVGDVIGIAVDLTGRKGWARRNNGLWNNDAAANPATGTNGVVVLPTVSFSPAAEFGGGSQQAGDAFILNCGQSAYAFSPPSGFGDWTQ